jgi:zinc/manganese transport system permease protein
LVTFGVALGVIAAVVAFVYRPLLFASVNAEVAEAKGVPVRVLSVIFMALLGLAVTMAVQAVGTLLLFALVVTPAATAILLTARPATAMAVATVLAVLSVWSGLTVSAMFNVPPSFVITTIVCTIWFVVWLVAQRSGADRSAPTSSHGAPAADH